LASIICALGVGQPAREANCVNDDPDIAAVMDPPLSPSVALGVVQAASSATPCDVTCALPPSGLLPVAVVPSGVVWPPLGVVGVGQPARSALRTKQAHPCFVPCRDFCPSDLPETSCACGVGHPIQPLPDVVRAEARSAGINRPKGVARAFHVRLNKVEPSKAVCTRNLFAKADDRTDGADEVVEGWPKVPLVSKPSAFACRAERLAGAGACPDGALVGPPGAAQGV
jgi:hypothetical protein